MSGLDAATIAAAKRAATNGSGGGMTSEQAKQYQQQNAKQQQMEEQKKQMLVQILSPEARERLATIRIVKPEKAAGIEMRLLKMAQQGQLRSQVGEKQLITMMEQIAEQQKNAGKITFARRKVAGWSDSEDDDDDSDLM